MKVDSFRPVLKKAREILLPTLVIIVTFFLTVKFLLPKVTQIPEFHRRLKKNEAQVLSLEKKATFLKEQKEGALFTDFEKVEHLLPREKDVAALFICLEHLKEDSNVSFESLDLKPGLLGTASAEVKSKQRNEFEVKISIVGPYDNLVKFSEKIENAAPLTSAKRAEINFKSGKDEVKANLLLQAHYLILKEEPLNIEKPLPELSSSLAKTLEKIRGFDVFKYATSLPEEKIGKENPFSFSD